MASPSRRFACLCLLLLSLANHVVLGQIRGVNNDADHDELSETIDSGSLRLLKRRKHHMTRAGAKGVDGVQKPVSGAKGGDGVKIPASEPPPHRLLKKNKHGQAGKGGAKGGEELETEPPVHHHPIEDSEFPHPHPEYLASGYIGETLVPAQPKGGTKGGGIKGTVKGALQTVTYKVKGAKQDKGYKEVKTAKGYKEVKADQGDKGKGGKKGAKNEDPIEVEWGKSTKAKSSKYDGKAVEKKQKEYNGKGTKSKDKLMKSAEDDYYTATEEPAFQEPTLVKVPLTFEFAFETPMDNSTLQGPVITEPTPEEIDTLRQAMHEYAVGLFEYLHEVKPGTFLSVTPTIDGVVFQLNHTHPLSVNATFDVLYNESPETAPAAEEVAELLVDAFGTDEFMYFYLWGRDDIWNGVTEVAVESRLAEDSEEEATTPSGPEAEVLATMVFAFSLDPTIEPTEGDFDQLTALTGSFYADLLTDYFNDNLDTTFEGLVVTRHATTYDLGSTPPVIVDYSFMIKFADNSVTYPSTDELFGIMAANTGDAYIKLYLVPCDCLWSPVNRVGFLEYTAPETEALSSGGSAPAIKSSMMYSFFPGMEIQPSEEDYEKLEMATSAFFHETLTAYYADVTDMLVTTTQMESQFYNKDTEETSVQVDYDTTVVLPGGQSPPPEEVLGVLQAAEFETYIMDYLWKEGDPLTNINGVILLERIPPPLSLSP